MISVVIPIFNEEENIPLLLQKTTQVLQSISPDFEIILIDDGSTDRSNQISKDYAGNHSHVKLIEFSRNFGHQAAISAGLKYARGEAVVIMDGDLQDPPEEIPVFINKWKSGYEVVYAIRTKRKEVWIKQWAYALFYRLLKFISDINIPLDAGDFCVLDRKVVDILNKNMPEQIRFVRGLRAFAGFRQIGIPFERSARHAGKAKYTFKKLLRLALDGIFDFSTFPLRIASYMGFLISLSALAVSAFFLFHRIFEFKVFGHSPNENPGITTAIIGIYFLGGLILIVLGIIGEYIGRIYYEVKRRPFYIVKEPTEKQQGNPQ